MIKVTNNEYQEIIRNAKFAELDTIFNTYEIIPFEVKNKNEKIQNLVNRLCNSEEVKTEHSKLYRGSIHNISAYGDSYTLQKLLGDVKGFVSGAGVGSINCTFKNDDELVEVSYCEGDVNVTVYDTIEEYNKGIEATEEFYKNY